MIKEPYNLYGATQEKLSFFLTFFLTFFFLSVFPFLFYLHSENKLRFQFSSVHTGETDWLGWSESRGRLYTP